MKILVLNAGSSTLKVQLLESSKNYACLFKGKVEGLFKKNDYPKLLQQFLEEMIVKKIIKKSEQIDLIGHRIVHGGEKYQKATIITPTVVKDIQKFSTLAPLHNPPNLAGISACQKLFPQKPQVAVFDTAFHQTIEPKAFLYALPYSFYKKLGIRRYGFHGTSHHYVMSESLKLLKKKQSRLITCHLGNGSSITAIKNGVSIDTSMGFTPLEGIPMGTRCGDIDPAIIFHLMKKEKMPARVVEKKLLNDSGLQGISEKSWDVRKLWNLDQQKDSAARRTFEVLSYRIAKYIGAYAAALGGLDALTFTGGIGENAWYLRQEICNYLDYLGLKLDPQKNKKSEMQIHAAKSKIKVYVIPTDEEREIAKEAVEIMINHQASTDQINSKSEAPNSKQIQSSKFKSSC